MIFAEYNASRGVVFDELAANDIFVGEMVNPTCANTCQLWAQLRLIIITFHVVAKRGIYVSN
jgi:hypothetical protein